MPHYGAPLPVPIDTGNLLATGLERWPDEPALVTLEGCWTWRELEKQSDAYGAHLLELGLEPGERVASLLPNCGAQFVHYLAMFKTGLVGVPLNYRYTPVEIDHALSKCDARAIVYDAERRGDIDSSERAAALPIAIEHGGDGGHTPRLENLFEPPPESRPFQPPDPAEPAFIFFTSGSTGPAKGVTHTHETLGWVLANRGDIVAASPDDILMAASSASHAGAFNFTLSALARGARAVLAPVGDPLKLLSLMRQWRPTVLGMMPAGLFQLVRDEHAKGEDFASLRMAIAGGDSVPAELEEEFTKLSGIPIGQMYGMTETGLSLYNPSWGLVKRDSTGRTSSGFVTELRDDAGAPVPIGSVGRLWVKFRGVSPYYWGDDEATAQVRRDGWLDTGDMLRADEQGYYWFCGRKKQLIIHDGSNIFPQEVEEALVDHEAVEAAGVIGIHDLVHGENVRAYVSMKEGVERPPLHELIEFARERVGYKAPEEIVVLDEMPITPTGKVDRTKLKQLAEEPHAAAESAAPAKD